MTPELQASLKRILSSSRVIPDDESLSRPVRCIRCRDTGLIEWISGEHRTLRGIKVTATEDRPVYSDCECKRRHDTEDGPRRGKSFKAA